MLEEYALLDTGSVEMNGISTALGWCFYHFQSSEFIILPGGQVNYLYQGGRGPVFICMCLLHSLHFIDLGGRAKHERVSPLFHLL